MRESAYTNASIISQSKDSAGNAGNPQDQADVCVGDVRSRHLKKTEKDGKGKRKMDEKTRLRIEAEERRRRRRSGTAFVLWVLAILAAIGFLTALWQSERRGDVPKTDTPTEGVGRVYVEEVPRYISGNVQEKASAELRVWCETDENLPEWWDPSSAEIVYQEPIAQPIHSDALDYNLNTTLWGWDGHGIEVWELELLSRIVYLEFNGTEAECINAGIDSILNLWDSEYFGRTLFDTLSATAENGALVYTTYGYVWDWDYDYDVLAEIRAICLDRFVNAPEYGCHFFQLYGFPWWAEPLYEIDSVYFSTFKEGTR